MFCVKQFPGGVLSILLALLLVRPGGSEEVPPINPETMAKVMELAEPGPEHGRLAALQGSWLASVKIWMEPGAEPILAEGQAENTMILDGRFLESNGSSGEGPMAGESLWIFGFDRRFEKYTVVGFDTWGTYYIGAEGAYNKEDNTIVMYGEDVDPIIGHTQKYDIIVKFVDDETFIWSIVFKDKMHTRGADEFKMVEVTYTRAD